MEDKIKLYFLSETDDHDDGVLTPRVPENFMTKNGYEDSTTPRVCFSTSVDGCLRALSENLTGKIFYVYMPDGNYKVITPTEKQVPDVKITNERWITTQVDVKMVGKIKVLKDAGGPPLNYRYGNNTAALYDWDWKWIEKYESRINEMAYEDCYDEFMLALRRACKIINSDTKEYDRIAKIYKKETGIDLEKVPKLKPEYRQNTGIQLVYTLLPEGIDGTLRYCYGDLMIKLKKCIDKDKELDRAYILNYYGTIEDDPALFFVNLDRRAMNETPEGFKQYYLFDHPVTDPNEFKKASPYNNALKVSLQNIPDAAGKTYYMYTASKAPRLAGVVRVKSQENGICDFTFVPQTQKDSKVTPFKNEETLDESSSDTLKVNNDIVKVHRKISENPNESVMEDMDALMGSMFEEYSYPPHREEPMDTTPEQTVLSEHSFLRDDEDEEKPKPGFSFSIKNEGVVISKVDTVIGLDRWKPEKGKNILFITGLSGSGKSTLAEEYETKYRAHMFELDGLEHRYDSSGTAKVLQKVREKCPEYDEYFKDRSQKAADNIDVLWKAADVALDVMKDDYKTLYIVEGVQLYDGFYPDDVLKGKPLIIKNTSHLTSIIRALKRTSETDEKSFAKAIKENLPEILSYHRKSYKPFKKFKEKFAKESVSELDDLFNDAIRSFSITQESSDSPIMQIDPDDIRNQFTTELTTVSELDANHETKEKKSLSSFKQVVCDEGEFDKWKQKFSEFRHVRMSDRCVFTFWVDNDEDLVAYVNIEEKDDHHVIQALEVSKKYQGSGLGSQLLKYAEKNHANMLWVNPENKIAVEMYKKAGWHYGKNKNRGKLQPMYKESVLIENAEDKSIGFLKVKGDTLEIHRKISENPNDPIGKEAHDLSFYLNGKKIAEISISAVDSDKAFLYNFEVFEPYRNKGYGTEILKYVLKNYKVNELTVDKGSKAIDLYKRFGFKVGKEFKEDGKDRVDMKINLNENVIVESSNTRPKVYHTKDITPESLVKIYKALNRTLKGKTLVKISTGEPGGHNYLKPELIEDLIKLVNGTIGDTNTAYEGKRNNTEDHMKAIKSHGFDKIADVDVLDSEGETALPIKDGYHLDEVLVGSHIPEYDSFLILSHFKGHAMAGYGGSIKNVAIGFASSHGKSLVHSSGKYHTGFRGNHTHFLESMVDSANGSMKMMGQNVVYINVANRLSVDCDCDAHPAEPTMKDLGIYASLDPVAVDQACIDAVYDAEDSKDLIKRIESRKGLHTLECAEKSGMGSRQYQLVELDDMNESAYTASGRRPKNYDPKDDNTPVTLESLIGFAKEYGLTPMYEEVEDEALIESPSFEDIHKLKSTPTTWDEFKDYWTEKRKLFRSNMWDDRDVSKEDFDLYQEYYDIMSEDGVSYDRYKPCFDRFCELFSLLPEITIVENLYFEHDMSTDTYTIFIKFSTGIVRVHIPDDIDLTHASPVENIEALIPTFKSKTKGKYFYPDNRVYFTIKKRIASNKAGLEDIKLYKYTPKEHISEAYIDPTYTRLSDGAVFLRTDSPIEVVPKTRGKNMNEDSKMTKEEIIKNHLRTNAMAYNGLFYIPDYMEQIKKLYGLPIFDFFYPSFRIFSFETRKATSLKDAKGNWYKVQINDEQHVSFCKQIAELIQKMIQNGAIEPGDLDLATEWKDEVVYHRDLLTQSEPYSKEYFKQCQYLHDLFWDPFDDPNDSGVICQNIIAFARLLNPELIGSINEHDGMITRQSLEQYIANEIKDDTIFLLKKKRKYPIINKESIKFAMDSIDNIEKSDIKEYVTNLNKFIEQYAYPYTISIDHPYAKYAPKKIILPIRCKL